MANLKITPQTVLLAAGQAITFAAIDEEGKAVAATWTLNPPQTGALAATSAEASNRTTSATYVAPATVPSPQTVAIIASAGTDSASASITLTSSVLSLTPASVTMRAKDTQSFVALVAAAPDANDPVQWLIAPQVGEISESGTYSAPETIGEETAVTVTATRRGLGASATAKVSLVAAPWTGFGVSVLGFYLFLLFCQVFLLVAIWPLQSTDPATAKVSRVEAEEALLRKVNDLELFTSGHETPAPTDQNKTTGAPGAKPGKPSAVAETGGHDEASGILLQQLERSVQGAQENLEKRQFEERAANAMTVDTWLGKFRHHTFNREIDLLCLVLLAGSLGAFLHLAQSFSAFTGNRTLKSSWVWWYALRPFVGAILALVLYAGTRGGLITIMPSSGVKTADLNAYGLAALSVLAGLFSKAATSKLGEVFDTLFQSDQAKKEKDKLLPATADGGAVSSGKPATGR